MSKYEVAVSQVIPAPAEKLYSVFADYHHAHPSVLPKEFTGVEVLEGGYGEGTRVKVDMAVYGVKVVYNMIMTEPEPGRVLAEEDKEAGVYTTFHFEPVNGGEATNVTIKTQMTAAPGFKGTMEKLINPPVMRRIYKEELGNAAEYVLKN